MSRVSFVVLFLILISLHARGQSNSTTGTCSPIVTEPKSDVTIRCDSAGLTKAQAEQQAREYAEILNKIRQENLGIREVITRLDSLKSDVGEVKKALSGRRINSYQREKLLAVLKSANKPNLDKSTEHGQILVFVPLAGGPEVNAYAMDFIKLERDAGYLGAEDGYGYGPLGDITGLQMNFYPGDQKTKRIPKICMDYASAISEYVEPVQLEFDPKSNIPAPGACWLLISFK